MSNSSSVPVVLDYQTVFSRVALGSSISLASTVGNTMALATFWKGYAGGKQRGGGKRGCRVVDIIMVALVLTSFLRGITLGPVRAACELSGGWPFGHSFCQFQAYFEAMLRNAMPWYLGFLSIERYTKHKLPHEYLVTFSPQTVNVILPGLLLVVIVQVTGPLYGWGKYEYIPDAGLCGTAASSTFGCSYALFLLVTLALPSFLVILVNSLLLTSLIFRKKSGIKDKRSLVTCGDSRVMNGDNEIPFLVVLLILFLLLSLPRLVLETSMACGAYTAQTLPTHGFAPSVVLVCYFLENLSDLLMPIVCFYLFRDTKNVLYVDPVKEAREEHVKYSES